MLILLLLLLCISIYTNYTDTYHLLLILKVLVDYETKLLSMISNLCPQTGVRNICRHLFIRICIASRKGINVNKGASCLLKIECYLSRQPTCVQEPVQTFRKSWDPDKPMALVNAFGISCWSGTLDT
uniref:Uncharacterized protein n=1 Tax=Picea glauca TaxID=3330 RepID=A0A124GMM9_PICGL|nr:hypothetical protein ABT39_MTgene1984 [Picea glauca]